MKKHIFLLVVLYSVYAQTQTVTISGMVSDTINKPLTYANVIANPVDKDISFAFTVSDEKGEYSLKIKKNKVYKITTSYLGYIKNEFDLKFSKDSILNFVLKEDVNQLKDITLSYTMPVTVKKDTITYNADSFTTGNERKLKDILKKLPGIEVDGNGNVLANGRKINTLLVENKPFFGGNTKLGVNNIPADAIKKIQVLENYNDVALLKGLQDSDKTALNIKLKENRKKFVFGDLEFGVGVKKKYLIHPKLFYYSPKTSVNFIGDVNNIGSKSFSIKEYINFEGGHNYIFKDISGYFKLYRSEFAKYLMNTDFKDNKTNFGAFNIRQTVSKSTDLSAFIIAAKEKTISETQAENQYLFDTPFSEFRTTNNSKSNMYTISKIRIDYKPNRKTDYTFSSNFKYAKSDGLEQIKTVSVDDNEIITNQDLETYSFKQNLSLNNKLSKKQTLTFNINYLVKSNKPEFQWETDKILLENLIPLTIEDYYKIRQEKTVRSNTLQAIIKNYWSIDRFHDVYISLGLVASKNNLYNKDFQLLENGNINNFSNSNFGNDFNHNFFDAYVGLEYKFKIGKATITPAIFYHDYKWNTQQSTTDKLNFSKKIFLPQLIANYEFRKSEKLKLKYNYNVSFPTTKSLINNFILTNFNSVYKGNDKLSNNLYHNLSLSYYKSKLFKGYSLYLNASYKRYVERMKNVSQLEGINQFNTQEMFYEPETSYSLSASFTKSIQVIKAKITTSFNHNDYYQFLNEVKTQNRSNTFSVTPSIRTVFKKYPNIDIGYKMKFNTYHHKTVSKYINKFLFATVDYDYKNFIFNANFDYNSYNNQENTVTNNYLIANASIFYQVTDKPWGFELNANNLFNIQYKQSNSINDFIISDSKNYILPRILMLKVTYKL